LLNFIDFALFFLFSFFCTVEMLATPLFFKMRLVLPPGLFAVAIVILIIAIIFHSGGAIIDVSDGVVVILGFLLGPVFAFYIRRFPPILLPIRIPEDMWLSLINEKFFPSGPFYFTGEMITDDEYQHWKVFKNEKNGNFYWVSDDMTQRWVTIKKGKQSNKNVRE